MQLITDMILKIVGIAVCFIAIGLYLKVGRPASGYLWVNLLFPTLGIASVAFLTQFLAIAYGKRTLEFWYAFPIMVFTMIFVGFLLSPRKYWILTFYHVGTRYWFGIRGGFGSRS